jgi:hypothetical protein
MPKHAQSPQSRTWDLVGQFIRERRASGVRSTDIASSERGFPGQEKRESEARDGQAVADTPDDALRHVTEELEFLEIVLTEVVSICDDACSAEAEVPDWLQKRLLVLREAADPHLAYADDALSRVSRLREGVREIPGERS